MPVYQLKCQKCQNEVEVKCPYEDAKQYKCNGCNSVMIIVPVRSSFTMDGFCAANGYHIGTLNYDGTGG